ncbi:peptidoglycan DD-metalloendopeptidase family protein [Desulfosporosinus sp.]|uniref:murein hydrolase activator EnvC family protein n=1 Tax=Desulfosporosinus sp. TaxID=157907 RepID=UPI00231F1324|nr:peptidoglycan DD-metalloendopeptidase family protein [Desulfosporosinus sp.]MCO5386116.1 peptidoglycan DD-metalloendopeptidase family protein [Desulfosporosinus sp.]MDA8220514.1 peptidoglycan DD-metalloendopeptidase family protein [Desulfitobacterium hafniense]
MFGKKAIPTVLVSLLLLGTSALPTRADQLGESIQQKNDIQSQKDQARGQLNKLTYTSEKMKTQLAQLETQVAAAQTALNQNKVAYVQAQTQVTVAQKELDQKQKELDDRRVALGKRARGIYESGQISHLELLFQSTDLSDFITRMEYFSKLVDNDRQLLEDIESQKAQISKKKSELQAKRDQAAKLEKESALVTADLEKKKSLQSNALEQNQKAQQAAFDEIDRLEAESKALTEKIRKLQATQAGKGSLSGNGTISTWPVPGYYEITSPFGWRTHPITKKRSMHTGTDVGAPTGTKLHAAGAGVVIMAGWNTAYGNMTIIDHGSGISTLYGHQSRLDVSEGQSVEANQVIGAVGSTGWSTGAHLHFEVRVGGNPTDPLQYFPN